MNPIDTFNQSAREALELYGVYAPRKGDTKQGLETYRRELEAALTAAAQELVGQIIGEDEVRLSDETAKLDITEILDYERRARNRLRAEQRAALKENQHGE